MLSCTPPRLRFLHLTQVLQPEWLRLQCLRAFHFLGCPWFGFCSELERFRAEPYIWGRWGQAALAHCVSYATGAGQLQNSSEEGCIWHCRVRSGIDNEHVS